jgi:hypothetical protein
MMQIIKGKQAGATRMKPHKAKHIYALAAPKIGIVFNSWREDKEAIKLLLSDRVYNKEAFANEFVVKVPWSAAFLLYTRSPVKY